MSDTNKAARDAVVEVASRCKALKCDLLTGEVKQAILLRDVLNPTTLRNGTPEWLLALHLAVTEFVS